MKTLTQYWTLEDEEFTVTIVSPMNLLDDYHKERMTEVLERHDLRSLEVKKIETMVSYPEQFPDLAYGTLYHFEATVGIPVNYENLRRDLAAWLKIKDTALFVSEDGNPMTASDVMPDAPVEITDIQGDVGEARIKKLMDYMDTKRDEKRKAREARDKTFVSNHATLKEHFGKGYKKGFYKCRYDGKSVIVEKQVTKWPEKCAYIDTLDSLNKLCETFARRNTMIRQLTEFEEKPDYKYLIENACTQVAQAANLAISGAAQPPVPQLPAPAVAETGENSFQIEWPEELLLIGELQKLLSLFGATVNSLTVNKSETVPTMITLSVSIGSPEVASSPVAVSTPVAQGY